MTRAARITQVDGLFDGVPYAYGAVAPAHARTVYLAGSCPLDSDGCIVAVGDVVRQASVCVDNMKMALARAGADLDDVVFVRVLVASAVREDLGDAWQVVRDLFGERTPPGTLMGVTALGWPDQLVEI